MRGAGQDKVLADVIDMRKLMIREQGSTGVWDIKRARAASWARIHRPDAATAPRAEGPEVLDTNTLGALAKLHAAGLMDDATHAALKSARPALPPHPGAAPLRGRAI